jgi:hypothetical protein
LGDPLDDRSRLAQAVFPRQAARRFTPSAVGVRLRLAPATEPPSRHLHRLRATSGRPGSLSRSYGLLWIRRSRDNRG